MKNWRHVNQSLPPMGKYVLVHNTEGAILPPTHWMNLPTAPSKQIKFKTSK
jgi:hypothetical protein